MNRKQFAILLVLLVVLGGAGLWLQHNRDADANSGASASGQKLLGDKFAVNDVTHIVIKHDTNELNLVRKDDTWRVRERSDYAANFQEIGDFLLKARDLKIVRKEQIGATDMVRMELAQGQGIKSGVLLDLKNKEDKSLQTVTLGKKQMRKAPQQQSQFGDEGIPNGRYVMLAGDPKNVLFIGDPLSNVEPRPETWLKKDFFKVERPKAIAVTFAEATNSWKLVRDTDSGDWKFAQAKPEEKLDSAKVSGVSNPFSSPSFTDVLPLNATPAEHGLDKPTVVTIETFDDFTYTIKVGRKSGDDYPLTMSVVANFPKERVLAKDEKPEDKAKADKAWQDRQKQLEDKLKQNQAFEKWTYLVPSYLVDPIIKDRKDLLVDKKEDPKPTAQADLTEEKK